jgi:hypothetical protein
VSAPPRWTGLRRAALVVAGVAAASVWVSLALADRGAWTPTRLTASAAALAALTLLRPVAAAWSALVLAPSRRLFIFLAAAVAAGVSWRVASGALRGTPLSIDASVYLLQARALSHLHFGWPAPSPIQGASHRFEFEGPDSRLYGVFPPGWPLAMVPFVWAGLPMLAGPVVAALLVVAIAALGREVGALAEAAGESGASTAELTTRTAILLSLTSYARAFHTAEPMSHGLVALLGVAAVACALRAGRVGGASRAGAAALVGLCVGWAIASRLLDGAIIALFAGAALVSSPGGRRAAGWALAGATPMVVLLCASQRAATGAWLVPTQTAYFARADWPPGCHRLGIGAGIGCTVEHGRVVAGFGPGGYDVSAALEVVRGRAAAAAQELVGFAPLTLLVFASLAVADSLADALGAAVLLAFTAAYGLFYYPGSHPFFGARHLFPAYPFAWLALARAAVGLPRLARGGPGGAHLPAAGAAVVLVVAVAGSRDLWWGRGRDVAARQATRSDLRRSLDVRGLARALLRSNDEAEVAAAADPWADRTDRLFALDDHAGLLEARRANPELPVFLALPGDELGALHVQAPPRGVQVELERSWPAFLWPRGLGASRELLDGASGGAVLAIAHATPGASLQVAFGVAQAGDYRVRLEGFAGPRGGDYSITLDGDSLPDWRGYAPWLVPARGVAIARSLGAGRHVLNMTCTGRDERSADYDARLDALVAEPATVGGATVTP